MCLRAKFVTEFGTRAWQITPGWWKQRREKSDLFHFGMESESCLDIVPRINKDGLLVMALKCTRISSPPGKKNRRASLFCLLVGWQKWSIFLLQYKLLWKGCNASQARSSPKSMRRVVFRTEANERDRNWGWLPRRGPWQWWQSSRATTSFFASTRKKGGEILGKRLLLHESPAKKGLIYAGSYM